jgi:hypothetical protein
MNLLTKIFYRDVHFEVYRSVLKQCSVFKIFGKNVSSYSGGPVVQKELMLMHI